MNRDDRYAALFVDFENIFYFLQAAVGDQADAADHVVTMIRETKNFLATERGEQCIVMHAYADFERIGATAQGPLYLAGVETHNVLGTEHKNAADMRLCIDTLETMYTRPEIGTFVLVAGDRDYIPVIQHLKKHARSVLAIAFPSNMSGDLLQNVGEENFFDAGGFLPPSTKEPIRAFELKRAESIRSKSQPATARPIEREDPNEASYAAFASAAPIKDDLQIDALDILLEDFGHHNEVWVGPYLNTLRRQMTHLAEFERKELITSLVGAGAVKVEKRPGDPHPYSVLVINWNHPDVRDRNPG